MPPQTTKREPVSSPVAEPLRIGCAGWTVPRETATRFPAEGSHLERYSQVFNCCEINSSFYRPHQNKTWERWAATVPPGFRFSVKAPKTITHEARLNCRPEILRAFLEQIAHAGEKLGSILVQLPPSLEFDGACVRRFLTLLRKDFFGDVVWEPRHATWFTEKADNLLKDFRIARVAADPACVPLAAQPGGCMDLAYFRLHGSPRMYYSAYSKKILKSLAITLGRLAEVSKVWCVFDNTAAGFAIPDALQLMLASKRTDVSAQRRAD